MDPVNTNNQNPEYLNSPKEEPTIASTSKLLVDNAKPIMSNLWHKFYAKKIVFWPVTIFFSLIFLIIILGLIFGRKKPVPLAVPRVTSTPFILSTPIASPSSEFLAGEYQKLLDLKNFLQQMDVKQQKLLPPNLNFEVKF
jgi:hypothetical protein